MKAEADSLSASPAPAEQRWKDAVENTSVIHTSEARLIREQ